MNGRYRSMLVAGVGFMMMMLCAAAGGADSLIVGDAVESTTVGFRFPDGTTQTTAYTGGTGGGITLTSPDGSVTVGGSSTAPTVKLNFTLTDALYAPLTGSANYAPVNGSANYAPASGSANYVAKGGDSMTGPLGVSIGTSATALSGTTIGFGKAGSFQINNSSSGSHALYVTTNGTGFGHSVYSYSTGLSRAGVFEINNAANGGEAVLAMTNGTGEAVHGYTTGTYSAGIFDINNTANSSDALSVSTNGNGRGGSFQINKAGNGSDALYATTNGSGSAVKGFTTGSGYAGYFQGGAGLYVNGNLTVSGAGAMPVYSNAGAARTAPHMVTGTIVVSGVGNVALSGAAAFSSAGSYTCTATMQATSPTVSPVGVQYISGTSFNLYCSTAASVSYICVGN